MFYKYLGVYYIMLLAKQYTAQSLLRLLVSFTLSYGTAGMEVSHRTLYIFL